VSGQNEHFYGLSLLEGLMSSSVGMCLGPLRPSCRSQQRTGLLLFIKVRARYVRNASASVGENLACRLMPAHRDIAYSQVPQNGMSLEMRVNVSGHKLFVAREHYFRICDNGTPLITNVTDCVYYASEQTYHPLNGIFSR
jgi:hypothetical protein